jgi:hypothetical protein
MSVNIIRYNGGSFGGGILIGSLTPIVINGFVT